MNKYSLNPSEQKTWQKMKLIMGSNRGRNNGASKKAFKVAVVAMAAFERAVLLEEHQMLVDKAEAKCEATEREMHSTKSLVKLAKCEYAAAQHKSVQANALFVLAKDEYAAAQHKAEQAKDEYAAAQHKAEQANVVELNAKFILEQANVVELNAKFILDAANDRAVSAKSAYAISQSDYESSKFDQHLDLFAETQD